jgi:type VI secretion system secreted protein VgrG
MATYTQQGRLLAVTTPLGKDVLLLGGLSGTEGLSRLFSYELEMYSEKPDIKPADLIGKSVTWAIQAEGTESRYFNGVVSRLSTGPRGLRDYYLYRAEVVPWLWFLTRTHDCKIFQNKSVPDIIKSVFSDLGFNDFELNLNATHSPWDYCVQYRETDFNFVSRLMEHEGIFYFFRHANGKHTLVLADNKGAYDTCQEEKVVYTEGTRATGTISSWEEQYEFRAGKWTQTDYNFESPSTNLQTSTNTLIDQPGASNYELFDYPGEYDVKGDGDALTKLRMEEEEAGYSTVTGSGECCMLSPGAKFTLEATAGDPAGGKSFVVASIHHSASESIFDTDVPGDYQNTFTCLPATVSFRPPRLTPKPVVAGPQTAVVVGPSGEEIYTDKYGRVKVQFFWDRVGQKDEKSSCWIRVAQLWAGKQWGAMFIPRIGQEVVVDFLEGDPDRPLITGRVYNADQMPPYSLPDNMTQSGVKSRSTKNGGSDDFNELRFEDKKDSEEVYFHAQKDFNRVVENNDTLKVGSPQADDGSQTIEIYKDRTETVKTGNEKVTVAQGNRNVEISMGNEALSIKMGNQTTKLDLGASSTEAMQSITLTVGQSSIKVDQMGVTIQGMMISIKGQIQTQVQAVMTQIQGSAMLQMGGGITMIG